MEMPPAEPVNAIREELKALAMSILRSEKPAVTLEDGALALEVAWRVMEEIEQRLNQKTL